MGKHVIAACEQLGLSVVVEGDPIARDSYGGIACHHFEYNVTLCCADRRYNITYHTGNGAPTVASVVATLANEIALLDGVDDLDTFCSVLLYGDKERQIAARFYEACCEAKKEVTALIGEHGLSVVRAALEADDE